MRLSLSAVLAILLAHSFAAFAQTPDRFDPVGHWTGAIVKEGSVLPVEIEIEATPDGYQARTTFVDWHLYRQSSPDPVRQTPEGITITGFLVGDAVLELEPTREQLFGPVGADGRILHLKRAVPPPKSLVTSRQTTFVSADGTRLSGTLTATASSKPLAGVVMVRGRGCARQANGKAQLFARYGIAVLTYDKRGAGQSEGDCATFTHEQLVEDAGAALEHLAAQPDVDAARVGLLGESAGAWIIQATTEKQRLNPQSVQAAFVVTWIGPATSIIQQQISSAATYGASVGLSHERQAILAEVSRIIVDKNLSDDEAYAKLAAYRRQASEEGWLDTGFGSDDIPATRADMAGLWLRRFQYDPAPFLKTLGDLPYLAVFGAKDPIVPVEENIAALENTGSDVTVARLPEAGHNSDFYEGEASLPSGKKVWIFEGTDPGFATSTITFLRERGFLTR
ncbi:MAG: alpha/beta hydrolase [Pseudomonadota bacterium]